MPDTDLTTPSPDRAPTRELPDQFAGLPVDVQWRMFRLLDVAIGMSHDEKIECAQWLRAAAELEHCPDLPAQMMRASAGLVEGCDDAAREQLAARAEQLTGELIALMLDDPEAVRALADGGASDV